MQSLLQDPIVQSVGVPFIVALVLAVIIRTVGGVQGRRFAVAAAGLGFLACYWVLLGVPAFPPPASSQKVFYLALLGLAVGIAVDISGIKRTSGLALSFVYTILILGWLGWRTIAGGPSGGDAISLLALLAGSMLVFWRVGITAERGEDETGRRHALAPGIMVFVGALGAGLVAFSGATASLSQLAVGLAMATAGFLLIGFIAYLRGSPPLGFGGTGAFGAASILVVLIAVMVLFADQVSKGAILLVALVFVFDLIARRVTLPKSINKALTPIVYGVIVAIPALAGVIVAALSSDSGSGY